MIHTKVLILGGGLAGLQAAYDLQQSDIDCLILEARDRVGGKVWSVPSQHEGEGGFSELGAAWTNDVNQPRVMALVRKLGLRMISQNIKGKVIMEGYGEFEYGTDPDLPTADKASLVKLRDTIEKLCHTIDLQDPASSRPDLNDLSLDDFAESLGGTSLARKVVNIWSSAMLGVSSKLVPAVYFLHYCRSGGGLLTMRSDDRGGGQHLRFRDGTQSLATGLASLLKPNTVVDSAAAYSVEQSPAGKTGSVVVRTQDGRVFKAQRVISTIPSTLLGRITFSPPLSSDKSQLISGSLMGFYAKTILRYSTPWWRERGLCGLTQGFSGPVSLTRDTSSDEDGMYALTCFIVGDSGRQWLQQHSTAEGRLAQVLQHVSRIYGGEVPQPIKTVEQLWNTEEFSMGAPCPVVPTTLLASLGRDRWRSEGNVHFAGTETSQVWKGYMEGALASGSRAAQVVADELRSEATISRAKL